MNIVTRENLRYNFLRTIIVRMDFQIILDDEIEKILPLLKEHLTDKDFSRFDEGISRDYNIKVPQTVTTDELTAKAILTRKYFSFINDNLGIKIDFSNSYLVMTINSAKYIPFLMYSNIFIETLNLITSNCSAFAYKRLGLRKINNCLINDISKINNYFSDKLFSFYDMSEKENMLIYNKKESFSLTNQFKTNLNCLTQQGKANDTILYKVEIDIDIYSENKESIEETIATQTAFSGLNDRIFQIYKDSLTSAFLEQLSSETFSDSTIIGVNSNE